MQDVIIVCAGTYGKEALYLIKDLNENAIEKGLEPPYRILGFLDDNPDAFAGQNIDIPIIGRISDWMPVGDEKYVIGAAFPATKTKLVPMLRERGCRFETLIAPWSCVSPDCEIGEGCFLTCHRICPGVKLGNFVNVNGSFLGPGTVIGDFSTTTGYAVVDDARIGERVFVGSHAVICPGVTVGDDAQVSVGSIVQTDVRPGTTVFGVPAAEIS